MTRALAVVAAAALWGQGLAVSAQPASELGRFELPMNLPGSARFWSAVPMDRDRFGNESAANRKRSQGLATAVHDAGASPTAPSSSRPLSRSEGDRTLLLSGEDWTIVSFEPGEGVRQRAFAEGYPAGQALNATVPGDIHWDLERAGKVPPIFQGMNSKEIGWVAGKEWWYRKRFAVPVAWQGKPVYFHFDAADYLVEVWLNGRYLGRHEGQFTPFDFEVADALRLGADNALTVLIHEAPAGVRQAIASGAGEWAVMQALRRAYPRWKSQTNAGWDWGAKIITMGLWQDVRLIAADGLRLSHVTVQPQLSPPFNSARLRVQAQVDGREWKDLELVCRVQCLTASDPACEATQAVRLAASVETVRLEIVVPKPQLWWPNGYGAQHLYELTLTDRPAGTNRELDRAATTFGIRDLQMLPNPDAPDNLVYMDYTTDAAVTHKLPQPPPDRRYLMQINGRRIFARGGNWLPCDLLYGRPRQPAYEHLIRLAAQANFNLFRVWGGGLIDKPVFYELCDRYGIMLFQEFPNAGERWPETDEALAIAARETREVLPLLINHPCVVRYGGGNEWYRDARNSRQMAQLRGLCQELDPTRPFHDPDPECIAQRHGPHSYDLATHYQVFNTGYPLSAGPDNPLEWTEYGASGASSVETLANILPAGHLWPIQPADPYWIWHKAFGAFGADNWMGSAQYLQLFGELPDLETTVRCSQFVQAEGLRYANQAMRRREWHRSACAFWTYNEPWPNAAHGCVVEYDGKPKMAYYYTRRAYAPVDVSAEYSSLDCREETPFPLKLFVTSDRQELLKGCRLRLIAMDTEGREYGRHNWRLDIPPEATSAVGTYDLKLPKGSAGRVVLVQLRLLDSAGRELSAQTYTFGVGFGGTEDALAALRVPAVSADGRRNLALLPGARPTASSVIPGYPIHQVSHLNNGWYGNEASWIEGESPAWAQIDLGAVYRISTVCVGNDHTGKFKDRGARNLRILAAVEYHDDSRSPTWQPVARYEGEPLQGTHAFDFPPVAARWVRVEVTEGAGTRLDEIEVYEADPLPPNKVAAAKAAAVRGPPPPSPAHVPPRGSLRPLLTAPATRLELSLPEGRVTRGPDFSSLGLAELAPPRSAARKHGADAKNPPDEPRSVGVPPASLPSVPLGHGPNGETPLDLAAGDGCATDFTAATQARMKHGPPTVQTWRARVRNLGQAPALFVHLETEPADARQWHIADDYFTLLPGEAKEVEVYFLGERQVEGGDRPARLQAKAWNSEVVSQPLGQLVGSRKSSGKAGGFPRSL